MKVNNIIFCYLILFFSFKSNSQVVIKEIPVKTTDSHIAELTGYPHRIFISSSYASNQKLLIYLPASFDAPGTADLFCTLASQNGYDVIALAYPGIDAMKTACEHSTNLNCYEDFHKEVIEGKNFTPFINIDSVNSIKHRLVSLLKLLSISEKRFEKYMDENNSIAWEKTVWAGHSDAAGHVGVIARYYTIQRAICFSGPNDFSLHYYLPSSWLSAKDWKTDKSRLFCFSHSGDEFAVQTEIWDSIGLKKYGNYTLIDQNTPPFKSSHTLYTNYNVTIGERHLCTVMDNHTPKSSSKTAIFEPVWKYLLDISGVSTPINNANLSKTTIQIFPNPIQRGGILKVDKEVNEMILYSPNGEILQTNKSNQMILLAPSAGNYILKLNTKSESIYKIVQII